MKKHISLLTTCLFSLMALTACSRSGGQLPEVDGGEVNRSYKAPTEITSTNITSFKAYFYLWDKLYRADAGSYSFTIEQNSEGEFVLSENSHYNLTAVVDKSILDQLQSIIEEHNLVSMNGFDSHTSGLPEEFSPCELSAVYDSGERLYFSEDNNPEAEWAIAMRDLFRDEFIRQGHDELLPSEDDRTIVRFDMSFCDSEHEYTYWSIFTEDDMGEHPGHYLKQVYNTTISGVEFDEVIAVPDGFYAGLSDLIDSLRIKEMWNDEKESTSTAQFGKYASYSIEMKSGLQINAYYEGDEADTLCELLTQTAEYIDRFFE